MEDEFGYPELTDEYLEAPIAPEPVIEATVAPVAPINFARAAVETCLIRG